MRDKLSTIGEERLNQDNVKQKCNSARQQLGGNKHIRRLIEKLGLVQKEKESFISRGEGC